MPKVSELMSQNIGNTMTNVRAWNTVMYNVDDYGIYPFPEMADATEKLQQLVNIAISEGRKSIFLPSGQYYVTNLENADKVYFFGDNASFIGGYNREIKQLGAFASEQELSAISNYNIYPQSPKPSKSGISTTGFKIVRKVDANEYRIVQITNKGNVVYTISNKVGSPSDASNHGGKHDLLRLVRAIHSPKSYVWFDVSTPVSGNLSTRYAPGVYGTMESVMYPNLSYSSTETFASSGQNGIGCYILGAGQSASYHVPASSNGKYNLLFMARSDASSDVSIKVGGKEVKRFNSSLIPTSGNSVGLVEFETLYTDQSLTLEITITNNDATNGFNICAINFFELQDYDRQAINSFKSFVGNRAWIDTGGSNDYAMADESLKWFGSYHGGETMEDCKLRWCSERFERIDTLNRFVVETTINSGSWVVIKQFEIEQRTDLIGRAKMRSVLSFDIDGSLEMSFSLYKSDILFTAFFTALTGTKSSFDYIGNPIFEFLPSPPSGQRIYFGLQSGFVSQLDSNNALQLNIRFTKFNDSNIPKGAYVLDNATYRKFYYGVVFESGKGPTPISGLSFEKGLDFIVR